MRAGPAALVVAGLVWAGAAPALAAPPVTGVQSNYWWEGDVSGTALLAPPNVPAGGLWVASGPSGPSAVSAVRFKLAGGATKPVLNLVVSTATPPDPAVVACPTTSTWKNGPGPSPWSSRPTSDCAAGAVTGVYASDGKSVSFDLSSMASPTGADIVIQAAPLAVSTPAESVTFTPVTAANVTATTPQAAPPASSDALPPAVPTAVPPDTTPPTTAYVPPVAESGLGATSAVASGQAPAVAVPSSPPVATPSLATPPAAASAPASNPAPVLAAIKGRSWRDRLLLGLAIFDIALYLLYQKRPGPDAAQEAVVRVGKPPALR